jgi:DNA-binding MarR family transcriptional regulator
MSNLIIKREAGVAAWTRLVRIYQRIDQLSRRNFRSLGLNSAWFDVLARVRAREGLSQGELASSLLVTKGNISQLVAKMESAGLIERRADGRALRIYLTDKGRSVAAESVPRQEALLKRSLSGLDPAEQAELLRLLRKWEKT